MSFVFTSIEFFDEFTGSGGGGVSYPNQGVMAKVNAEIEGYFYLAYQNKQLRFDAEERTITIINDLDSTSFLDDGLLKGKGLDVDRIIAIEGTVSNNVTRTITAISEDGRTITVNDALVDEDALEASIYDDTPIVAMDFSYNLIENNEAESYLSKTDTGAIQRFTVDEIDANDDTPVNMLVSSSSFGWVTNTLLDDATGETDEVTVEGANEIIVP